MLCFRQVSLFAELFNEMLMRDFGFAIYKALMAAPVRKDAEKDNKKSKDKDGEKKKDKEEKEKDDSSKKDEKKESSDEPSGKKRKVEDEKERDRDGRKESSSSKRDEREKDEEHSDEDAGKRKEKLKYITDKPDLLMAFVYFDQSHTGYLMDKDVEEILYTLGLHLSRAQVGFLLSQR